MRIQLFPGLLLVLFFLFSFVGTCPLLESEQLCPFFQIPPIPLSSPSEAVPIVHNSVVSHYSLKFERYSKWIKDQSKYFWKSREDRQDVRDYVSPYLTKFEAKRKAGWWASLNLIRLWRHFLWELPEWLTLESSECWLQLPQCAHPEFVRQRGFFTVTSDGTTSVYVHRGSTRGYIRCMTWEGKCSPISSDLGVDFCVHLMSSHLHLPCWRSREAFYWAMPGIKKKTTSWWLKELIALVHHKIQKEVGVLPAIP